MDSLSGPERRSPKRVKPLTEDWNEAKKKLRERLQARDDNLLDVVRKGEILEFRTMGGLLFGELFEATHAS